MQFIADKEPFFNLGTMWKPTPEESLPSEAMALHSSRRTQVLS